MRRTQLLVTLCLLPACSDVRTPTAAPRVEAGLIGFAASEGAATGANPHFMWLPPLAPATQPAGPFDPDESPLVVICERQSTGCGQVVAAFGRTGTGGSTDVRVSLSDSSYIVNWRTDLGGTVVGEPYRIRVFLGGDEVGHGDITLGDPRTGGINFGATLPIRFRLEKGVLGVPGDAAAPLVAETRGLLTAADKPAAFQALLRHYAELYRLLGSDEARRQLGAVTASAFDPVRDASALAALNTALGGHLFDLDFGAVASPNQQSRLGVRASSLAAQNDRTPTTIFFINGIYTNPGGAAANAVSLWDILEQRLGWHFGGPSLYHGKLFYNPYAQITGHTGTLSGAATQVLNILGAYPSNGLRTSLLFADAIGAEMRNYRQVVIVAHSQGNLMSIEALKATPVRECVGVVGIAPPTSQGWPGGLGYLKGVIAKGKLSQDILLYIPLVANTDPPFARVATSRTALYDAALAAARPFPEVAAALALGLGLDLHLFTDHYVAEQNTAAAIAAQVSDADQAVLGACGQFRFSPGAVSVTVGKQQVVTVDFVDASGGSLSGRPVTYAVTDPTIATVSGNGPTLTVTGVTEGATYLVARSAPVRDSIPVTVGVGSAGGMIDLGGLGGPGGTYAYGINDSGQVVGYSVVADPEENTHAFLWTAEDGMRDLGTLAGAQSYAYDINDRGQVVGESETAAGPFRGFLWTAEGGMRDLGSLVGDENIAAMGINNSGQVVGQSAESAFLWTEDGGMRDLGIPVSIYTVAIGINDSGQVVGQFLNASGQVQVFLWTAEGGMRDLGIPGVPKGINSSGQIVGWFGTAGGRIHAFLWTAEGVMRDLGTVCDGDSAANGINDHGQVVGWCVNAAGQVHAFLWTAEDGMRDLGTLGGTYSIAYGINTSGQVVGESMNAAGQSRAFLWTLPR